MLRAMDSAVAGLRAHQNKLDVISNNIANVNTNGFKAQNYTFKDTMYQTSNASAGASDDKDNAVGGTNASQYGYGSVMGSISLDMTTGTPSYVGGFNAAIDGSGFFITNVSNAAGDLKTGNYGFTRVGQFNVDSSGNIVNADGSFVYGYAATTGTNAQVTFDTKLAALKVNSSKFPKATGSTADPNQNALQSVEIDNQGTIKGVTTGGQSVTIGRVAIAMVENPNGLTKGGSNTFNTKPGDNAGDITAVQPGGTHPGLMAGYLESSNVDMAKEFSDMITAERGFQANSKIITVSDEVLQELVNMKR